MYSNGGLTPLYKFNIFKLVFSNKEIILWHKDSTLFLSCAIGCLKDKQGVLHAVLYHSLKLDLPVGFDQFNA